MAWGFKNLPASPGKLAIRVSEHMTSYKQAPKQDADFNESVDDV